MEAGSTGRSAPCERRVGPSVDTNREPATGLISVTELLPVIEAAERTPTGVAFVLAGGATRGASQVGMLQALTEAGITPDLIVGTSVGALNGAYYSQAPTLEGLDILADLWASPPRAEIFPLSPLSIAQNLRRKKGYVLDNGGLRNWIRTNTHIDRLEGFPIPLHVVATDATTRTPVVLSEGDTVEALLASSAIPGVFPAITVAGQRLIDGGASADIPLAPALSLAPKTIYVLPTSPLEPPPPSRIWQLLDRLFGTPAAALDTAHPDDVEVHWLPPAAPEANPVTFRASRRLVAESRSLARRMLDDLQPPPPHAFGVDLLR